MKTIEKLPLFQEVTSNDSAHVCGGKNLIVKATIDLGSGQINMEYEEQQGNNFLSPYYRPYYNYFSFGPYSSYYGPPMVGYYV